MNNIIKYIVAGVGGAIVGTATGLIIGKKVTAKKADETISQLKSEVHHLQESRYPKITNPIPDIPNRPHVEVMETVNVPKQPEGQDIAVAPEHDPIDYSKCSKKDKDGGDDDDDDPGQVLTEFDVEKVFGPHEPTVFIVNEKQADDIQDRGCNMSNYDYYTEDCVFVNDMGNIEEDINALIGLDNAEEIANYDGNIMFVYDEGDNKLYVVTILHGLSYNRDWIGIE